jgi:hypothetical protein
VSLDLSNNNFGDVGLISLLKGILSLKMDDFANAEVFVTILRSIIWISALTSMERKEMQ